MAEQSAFRGVIQFFADVGVYDVVLPFLLIFSIVFAILDKTRVFGSDKVGDVSVPKKNLNAMVAFTIAFFVIASAHLVEVITKISSHMVMLLLGSVFFLTLIGSFMKESEEGVYIKEGQTYFIIAMLIGIVLIFLNALNWLEPLYEWLTTHWNNEVVASIVLVLIILGVMIFITKPAGKKEEKSEK